MNKVEYPKSYIVWDLETSGLKFDEDKILEIGMYRVEDGETVEEKRWVLNNRIDIPEFITNINGMTTEIAEKEGVEPSVAFKEFLTYLRCSKANLTHNGIGFDIPFLVEQAAQVLEFTGERKEKFRAFLEDTAVDTAVIFKARIHEMERKWNESFIQFGQRVMSRIIRGKFNLGVCCDELGIDRSTTVQHRALGDVYLTNEVFKELLVKCEE